MTGLEIVRQFFQRRFLSVTHEREKFKGSILVGRDGTRSPTLGLIRSIKGLVAMHTSGEKRRKNMREEE